MLPAVGRALWKTDSPREPFRCKIQSHEAESTRLGRWVLSVASAVQGSLFPWIFLRINFQYVDCNISFHQFQQPPLSE